jgi:hypothetical protein
MFMADYFDWEWKQLAGKSCLSVAPRGMVDDELWITFFNQISDTFPDGEAFVIVDVRDVEDQVSWQGFEGIIDVFKKKRVKFVVTAVITTDQHHDVTAKLFRRLAEQSSFNLQINTFDDSDLAKHWMEERIRSD